MRGYDDRYTRDMRRHDLAIRLIRHEARTQTIRSWTGLTEERIRKLYRTYCVDRGGRRAQRHRGPPPLSLLRIMKSRVLRSEAVALAGLCYAFGVIPSRPAAGASRGPPSLSSGERLCYVFEVYQVLVPDTQLDLEQLILLVAVLAQGTEVVLGCCSRCKGGMLIDMGAGGRGVCTHCGRATPRCETEHRSPPVNHDESADDVDIVTAREDPQSGYQRSLFEVP